MKVLQVTGSPVFGGAEQYLARLSPELRKHGVDAEVYFLKLDGPLLSNFNEAGVALHGRRHRTHSAAGKLLMLFSVLGEIRDLALHGGFDVIHSYLFLADVFACLGGTAARHPRLIESRRSLRPWRHDFSRVFDVLELVTNSMADELIANSYAVMANVESTEHFVPKKRTVIYNGVDPADYQPTLRSERPVSKLSLLTVGALAPRKGQSVAIDALALTRSAGLECELVLVGGGPDEQLLRLRAQQLSVSDCVVFTGPVADPRPYLSKADVFVLPSRQEGFSNALLEAMAAGLPAIATDVGGNSEALVDGSGGRIIPANDAGALAEAILNISADASGLSSAGLFNRRRLEQDFSLEESARRLADWYLRDR